MEQSVQQEIKERIKDLLKALNVNREQISTKLGYKKSYFDQMLSGNNNVSESVLLKLSKNYKEVNLNWILTGEGEMMLSDIDLLTFQFEAITEKFANNFRLLRENEGLTQGEMAQILGLYEGKIQDMEAGRAGPSLAIMVSLRNLYNIRIDDMLFSDMQGDGIDRAYLSYTDEVRAKEMEEIMEEVRKEVELIRKEVDFLKSKP
jgi:transcriptional regulator with XRE-family HTH domain